MSPKSLPQFSRQNGVAVVTAMLVAALAAMLAVHALWFGGLELRRLENRQSLAQARQLVLTGIDWGRSVLADDLNRSRYDHPAEIWAHAIENYPVDGMEEAHVSGQVEEQQGRFDLNRLIRSGRLDPREQERLRRLMVVRGINPARADTLAQWLENLAGLKAEGKTSTSPIRLLTDVEELGASDLTDGELARLKPWVCALPQAAPVNLNFLPTDLLARWQSTPDEDLAARMEAARNAAPFRDLADFRNRARAGGEWSDQEWAASSRYFLLDAAASVGRAHVSGRALVERKGLWPTVIWRKTS